MFINTQYFREAAIHFERYGRYEDGEPNTVEWEEYWDREHDRVYNGYSVGGRKITGKHYLYLNYLPIKRITEVKDNNYAGIHKSRAKHSKKVGKRDLAFPDFWDEDFVIFHSWDIAKYGINEIDLEELDKSIYIPIIRTPDNLSGGHHHLWLKPRGVGAEQPHDEILITPDGEITMGDVKVGTQLYDKHGNITNVTEVLPQGIKQVWEVELLDGRKVTCGENHLWTVETRVRNGKPEYKTLTTKKLLDSGLVYNHSSGQKTYKYKIPELQPVKFEEKELSIPPYVLGALLGDGTINGKNIKIASDDIEIVDNIINDLNKFWKNSFEAVKDDSNNNYLLKLINRNEYLGTYGENSKFGCNPLKRELELLQVNVKCDNKFIPNIYKFSSIEQRLELVKGLMDTDGSVTEQGYCEFTNKSEKLIDDLAYILRSLGIYCNKGFSDRQRTQTIIDNSGRSSTFVEEKYYRLYIATNQNLFKLQRKSIRINTKKRTRTSVPIVNIKPTQEYKEQSCIIVDNEEHLYLTRDFIVTHNSWKGAIIPIFRQFFEKNNSTFIVADQKQYLLKDGIFEKYLTYRDRLIKYSDDNKDGRYMSGFARQFNLMGTKDMEYRCAYYATDSSGNRIEKGRKTSVYGVIIDGNPDNMRGKRGSIIYEEFGSFPNVDKAWEVAQSSVEEDGVVYDTMYGFGTGGDEGSGIVPLTKMFYDPKAYNLLQFSNNWDEHFFEQSCAYFTPAYRTIGFKDLDGNSLETEAKEHYEEIRQTKKEANDPSLLPAHQAEKPFTPQEALLNAANNIFPVTELLAHKNKLIATGLNRTVTTVGEVVNLNGILSFQPNSKLKAFEQYPVTKGADKIGAVVILHSPFKIAGQVPKNLYRISVDPYRHDSTTGDSIGSVYVVENPNRLTPYKGDKIVAWYNGRPASQDEFNKILFDLALLYNAKIAPENDEPGDIIGYAKRKKLLQLLEGEFELAYDDKIKTKAGGTRSYGMHIASGKDNLRKRQGDKYIQEWLLRERGITEEGNRILNLHTIYDMGLLEELIKYKEEGNYDRISSLRINMFYEREFLYKNKTVQTVSKKDSIFNRVLFQ